MNTIGLLEQDHTTQPISVQYFDALSSIIYARIFEIQRRHVRFSCGDRCVAAKCIMVFFVISFQGPNVSLY